MGLYAEAQILADMLGKEVCDLDPDDWAELEGAQRPTARRKNKARCKCGRRFHDSRALSQHRRDKGCEGG